jgi:hypothetical protein
VLLRCRRKRGGRCGGRPHYRGGRVCGKCERNSPPRFCRPITVHPLFHHNASCLQISPKRLSLACSSQALHRAVMAAVFQCSARALVTLSSTFPLHIKALFPHQSCTGSRFPLYSITKLYMYSRIMHWLQISPVLESMTWSSPVL